MIFLIFSLILLIAPCEDFGITHKIGCNMRGHIIPEAIAKGCFKPGGDIEYVNHKLPVGSILYLQIGFRQDPRKPIKPNCWDWVGNSFNVVHGPYPTYWDRHGTAKAIIHFNVPHSTPVGSDYYIQSYALYRDIRTSYWAFTNAVIVKIHS